MKHLAQVDLNTRYGATLGRTASLGRLFTLILSATIAISAIIVIFLFIRAGYQIISATGSADPKRQSQGKQTLTYAIIGFIITLSAYWIIRLIEEITNASLLGINIFGGP